MFGIGPIEMLLVFIVAVIMLLIVAASGFVVYVAFTRGLSQFRFGHATLDCPHCQKETAIVSGKCQHCGKELS